MTLVGVVVQFVTSTEVIYNNYHLRKSTWANYKNNKGKGVVPPYQVALVDVKDPKGNVIGKHYKVIWESFKENVQ